MVHSATEASVLPTFPLGTYLAHACVLRRVRNGRLEIETHEPATA